MHSYPTDTCTVSLMKVAPTGASPTITLPAYDPYQMPILQKSYTKVLENSNMPTPYFEWQQGSYDEWVEKLHQWLGRCDPAYREANEAGSILSTLPQLWLKGIITTQVAKGTQHQRTPPTLKELWDLLEHRCHEYDPSRANERWRALSERLVEGQVSFLDSKDFYNCWQRLLPLSNQTRPHVICQQLLSKVSCIKEKVVEKEAKISRQLCG